MYNSWAIVNYECVRYCISFGNENEDLNNQGSNWNSVRGVKRTNQLGSLMFTGPCIIVIVENKRPTWCHLLFLFHFLCAQHVSDINISIIRILRLFCWITTLVVFSWFDVCWSFGVVGLEWYLCCRLKNRRKLLVMDILMSETCCAH